ncbi:MAG: DUF86 domain-containing protein [Actinobacteria bacterium]|nr:DUF86 domain-containing protein [Actinomycetota bacterium]
MPRDDLLLTEIIDAIVRIRGLVERIDLGDPFVDRDLVDALLWNYTVLGEAANGVSDRTKSENPDVRWADPVRLRNRIVHGYWSIDIDILLSTAGRDLDEFGEAVQRVLDER